MRDVPVGRPRAFDTREALEKAMRVFWAQGYEGATLADLTNAMGITKTSMYAAFGNKEELFRQALALYSEGPAAYGVQAVKEQTARRVAEAFLQGSVRTSTRSGDPAGCLGVQGALAVGATGRIARDVLADWRRQARSLLSERFQRAADEGDLPPGVDPEELALYVMTVAHGIAVQAASGVAHDELQHVVETALRNWPVS